MWYTGYHLASPVGYAIYHAYSTDGGFTWYKYDNNYAILASDTNGINGQIPRNLESIKLFTKIAPKNIINRSLMIYDLPISLF
jgi:hypothetical protein